jgi:GDPmannose 4,6-dehydratase
VPRALITGITGQDGLYLGELLASKGYEVFGLVRGQSNPKVQTVEKIIPSVQLIEGDLTDLPSLIGAMEIAQPDEVYNLGAISFVGLSWKQAELTGEITGMGVLRVLEAIRIHTQNDMSKVKFYQASSSEMFGKVRETPQTELTPFHPRSPYGVAKTFGHYMTVNYRESYDAFACSGILFNHESVTASTPVVVRDAGYIDVLPIGELLDLDAVKPEADARVQRVAQGLQVWDGQGWVGVDLLSAYWHEGETVKVHARGGLLESTPDHVHFRADQSEVPAQDVVAGDRLALAEQPWPTAATVLTEQEAWLLGFLAAEGHVTERDGHPFVVCGDELALKEVEACWAAVAAGAVRRSTTPSGFSSANTPRLDLIGNRAYGRLLRHELYCRDGSKRVPVRVLNAAPPVQQAFFDGYYRGDGLKAGNGTDPYRSFRTTSSTLATGLMWIARHVLGRKVSVYEQPGALGGGTSYLVNLTSGGEYGGKGAPLRKPADEVRKVERHAYSGWMCDLATETERYAAGVGLVVTHNSPRRGYEFVTRKVTRAVARISLGLADNVSLGNLEARRDWGFAGDYVDAMWRMLQQDAPDDYVVATNETHTIRELLDVAFARVGIDDWEGKGLILQDPRFFRPAEVDLLIGDPAKAKQELGWEPRVGFRQLIEMMVDSDLQIEQRLARQEA